jgi:hypothetical protein
MTHTRLTRALFRISDEFPLLKMNIDLYRDVATRPPVAGAKPSRPDTGKADLNSFIAKATIK